LCFHGNMLKWNYTNRKRAEELKLLSSFSFKFHANIQEHKQEKS